MRNSHFVAVFAVFIFGILGIISCGTEPTFPLEPVITFNNIFVKNVPTTDLLGGVSNIKKDSVIIEIGFQDGDGDLGATEAEIKDLTSKQKYNYIVNRFVKRNGVYVLNNPIPTHSAVFGLIRPLSARPGPIQGNLNFSIDFLILNGTTKDSVYFDVQIIDRVGNLSNTIRTKPVAVYKL